MSKCVTPGFNRFALTATPDIILFRRMVLIFYINMKHVWYKIISYFFTLKALLRHIPRTSLLACCLPLILYSMITNNSYYTPMNSYNMFTQMSCMPGPGIPFNYFHWTSAILPFSIFAYKLYYQLKSMVNSTSVADLKGSVYLISRFCNTFCSFVTDNLAHLMKIIVLFIIFS